MRIPSVLAVAVTAGMCGSVLGQASFVAVPTPLTDPESLLVKDMNKIGTVLLVEKRIPGAPTMMEYSLGRPDGSLTFFRSDLENDTLSALNGDGTAIWGTVYSNSNIRRITGAGSAEEWSTFGAVNDVSEDERFVVGTIHGSGYHGWRWDRTAPSGQQVAPVSGLPSCSVLSTRPDGAYMCGWSATNNGGSMIATVWAGAPWGPTLTQGLGLPLPQGGLTSMAVSIDSMGGTVGTVFYQNITARAAAWPPGGGVRVLPLAVFEGRAQGVSGDGRVIVGSEGSSVIGTALVWIDGARHNLLQYLAESGVTGTDGYLLYTANRVSEDGCVVCGKGRTPTGGWMVYFATLPALPCVADMGSQGGAPGADDLLDNNDFIVFIERFFTSDVAADIGRQGGVVGGDSVWDNNDFIVFIDRFFTGCP